MTWEQSKIQMIYFYKKAKRNKPEQIFPQSISLVNSRRMAVAFLKWILHLTYLGVLLYVVKLRGEGSGLSPAMFL